MTQMNVHQAKTSLSRLMHKAEAGEDVIIARNGKPSVRLVPIKSPRRKRIRFGDLKGKIWYSDDMHLPMSDAEIAEMDNDPLFLPARRRRK